MDTRIFQLAPVPTSRQDVALPISQSSQGQITFRSNTFANPSTNSRVVFAVEVESVGTATAATVSLILEGTDNGADFTEIGRTSFSRFDIFGFSPQVLRLDNVITSNFQDLRCKLDFTYSGGEVTTGTGADTDAVFNAPTGDDLSQSGAQGNVSFVEGEELAIVKQIDSALVRDVADIEEVLELEEAQFRISNTSFTLFDPDAKVIEAGSRIPKSLITETGNGVDTESASVTIPASFYELVATSDPFVVSEDGFTIEGEVQMHTLIRRFGESTSGNGTLTIQTQATDGGVWIDAGQTAFDIDDATDTGFLGVTTPPADVTGQYAFRVKLEYTSLNGIISVDTSKPFSDLGSTDMYWNSLVQSPNGIRYEDYSFSVTGAEGVEAADPSHYLSGAGDPQKPWVAEISEGGDVLFSGIIDGASVSYNAQTRETTFDVLSWLELVDKAPSLPAKAKYETEILQAWNSEDLLNTDELSLNGFSPDGVGAVRVNTPLEFLNVDNVGIEGDTLIIDTGEQELRTYILGREVLDDTPVYYIPQGGDGEPLAFFSKDDPRTQLTFQRVNIPGVTNQTIFRLQNREIIETILSYTTDPVPASGPSASKEHTLQNEQYEVRFKVYSSDGNLLTDTTRDSVTSKRDSAGRLTLTVESFVGVPPGNLDEYNCEVIIRLKSFAALLKASIGDTVHILSKSAYGYDGNIQELTVAGETVSLPVDYSAKELTKALFQLNDLTQGQFALGVLPQVFDETEFDAANADVNVEPIDPHTEFEQKALDSLREIQLAGRFLFEESFSTRQNTQGDDIPVYTPKMIPRDRMFAEVNVVEPGTPSVISEWSESVTPTQIDAVVIRSNREYYKGRAGADTERVGFYYEGIEEFESSSDYALRNRSQRTVPEGADVIEIELPMLPRAEGTSYIWTGGNQRVENNAALREMAKRYYTHFKRADREVQFTVKDGGEISWKGGYWYFQDQGTVIDDAVFVTEQTRIIGGNEIETQLKGRIGTFLDESSDTEPVAVIQGPDAHGSRLEESEVNVVLDGSASYTLNAGGITYEWQRKRDGESEFTTVGTSNLLDDTVSSVPTDGEYITYRLVVCNAEGTNLCSSVDREVYVYLQDEVAEPPTAGTNIETKAWRQDDGGVTYGYVWMKPQAIDVIADAEFRSAVGSDIPGSTSYSDIGYHADTNYTLNSVSVEISGKRTEHYTASVYVESSSGALERFGVESVSYSEVDDATTVTIASEDQSRFQSASLVETGVVSPGAWVERVELNSKHASTVEMRLSYNEVYGKTPATFTHTFDITNTAQMSLVDIDISADGSVFLTAVGDEDTTSYEVEVSTNQDSASPSYTTIDIYLSDVAAQDIGVQLADGQFVDIKVSPQNSEGVIGKTKRVLKTYFAAAGITGDLTVPGSLFVNGTRVETDVETVELRHSDMLTIPLLTDTQPDEQWRVWAEPDAGGDTATLKIRLTDGTTATFTIDIVPTFAGSDPFTKTFDFSLTAEGGGETPTSYEVDFGDSSTDTGTTPPSSVSHTYTKMSSDQTYTVTFEVDTDAPDTYTESVDVLVEGTS